MMTVLADDYDNDHDVDHDDDDDKNNDYVSYSWNDRSV